MKFRSMVMVIAYLLFTIMAAAILSTPGVTAMTISGTISCLENTSAVLPGNSTRFLLNVSVGSSGIGEDVQGIRVELSVDDAGLSVNLSTDRLDFGIHGGSASVELFVSAGSMDTAGPRTIVISGMARPLTGPVPGVRTFRLSPGYCALDVERIRGCELAAGQRTIDLHINHSTSVNIGCNNLGNESPTDGHYRSGVSKIRLHPRKPPGFLRMDLWVSPVGNRRFLKVEQSQRVCGARRSSSVLADRTAPLHLSEASFLKTKQESASPLPRRELAPEGAVES